VSGVERRRLARIPLRCAVTLRDKHATFPAETADVGARGCRITLARQVARGALLRLSFEGAGPEPFDAVGQVVWARKGETHEAGVAFVSAPKGRAGAANWIDAMFAAQLRSALRAGTGARALEELAAATLRLGVPPRAPLPPVALAIAGVAEREGRVSEVLEMRGGIVTLASLVEHGVVTLGRASAHVDAWARLLAPGRARVA
jgi:hypothetical protein